jgi:leucyl-tRNA synthetase
MSLLNEIYNKGTITKDEVKTLVLLLCPFAPHLAEEMWEKLGETGLCSIAKWPEWDEKKCEDKTVEIAIQVLGKLKGTVTVAADADKDFVLDLVKKDERIKPLIEGKTIVKEIYVPGKIVNIVVK